MAPTVDIMYDKVFSKGFSGLNNLVSEKIDN